MVCKKYVTLRMPFTDYKKFPFETTYRAVRYKIVHDHSCVNPFYSGLLPQCEPEEVDEYPPEKTNGDDMKWHLRFLDMARLVSTWSRDPSTQCGAVLVRPNKTVISLGFNGFPRGCDDNPAFYADREKKLERTVHAEVNAVLAAPERPVGATLYTWPPSLAGSCSRCATVVIQAGIVRVVYPYSNSGSFNDRWKASQEEALLMYQECGLEVVTIPEEAWRKALNVAPFSAL